VKTVLKIYLEKGTQEMFISEKSDLKLFKLGFITMNRGGYIHNSSRGLRDCIKT
jgi:hypothetical protein